MGVARHVTVDEVEFEIREPLGAFVADASWRLFGRLLEWYTRKYESVPDEAVACRMKRAVPVDAFG